MARPDITLLELHFHNHGDVQIGPSSGTSGDRTRLADRLRQRAKSGGSDGGRGIPIPLQAVVALGGLAFAAMWWALRGR